MDSFLGSFMRDPSWDAVDCPCRWRGRRGDLRRGESLERYHPTNRAIIAAQGPVASVRFHFTQYEACPACGRWHWADGQQVFPPHDAVHSGPRYDDPQSEVQTHGSPQEEDRRTQGPEREDGLSPRSAK